MKFILTFVFVSCSLLFPIYANGEDGNSTLSHSDFSEILDETSPCGLNLKQVHEIQRIERKKGNGEHITTYIVLYQQMLAAKANKDSRNSSRSKPFRKAKRKTGKKIRKELGLSKRQLKNIPPYAANYF